jgi:hypothetical protein
MGLDNTKNSKNNDVTRPTKSGKAKRQRQKVQAKRLMAFGVSEEQMKHLSFKDVRDLLKYPKKLQDGTVKVI